MASIAYMLTLQSLPRMNRRRSGPERTEDGARITVMQAMADPKKTAAVYFAMTEAMAGDGFADHDKAEAEALCRAFGEEPLSDEERQAVERLTRKRHGGMEGDARIMMEPRLQRHRTVAQSARVCLKMKHQEIQ